MSKPSRIVITIDTLVLHGVASADAATVSRALRQTLQQELATRGISLDGQRSASVVVDTLQPTRLPPSHSHYGLGQAAGRAVYRSIRSAVNIQRSGSKPRSGGGG